MKHTPSCCAGTCAHLTLVFIVRLQDTRMDYTLRVMERGGDAEEALDITVDGTKKVQVLMEATKIMFNLPALPRLWEAGGGPLKAQQIIKDRVKGDDLLEYEVEGISHFTHSIDFTTMLFANCISLVFGYTPITTSQSYSTSPQYIFTNHVFAPFYVPLSLLLVVMFGSLPLFVLNTLCY